MTVKILLVLDAGDCRRWHRSIEETLRKAADVRIAVVPAGTGAAKGASAPAPILSRLVPDLRPAPGGAVSRHAPSGAPPDLSAVDLSAVDLSAVAPASFDLIVDLTTGRRVVPPAGVPVWSLVTPDGRALLQRFPFLEEAYRAGSTATIALVERRGPNDADAVVESMTLAPTRRSYAAFLRGALRLARAMLVARCGAPAATPPRRIQPVPPSAKPGATKPGAAALLRFLGRGLVDHVWHQNRDRLLMEEWKIGYLERPIGSTLADPGMADARWLDIGRPGDYVADPFGVPGADDRLYCEVYNWASGRGDIREMTVSGRTGSVGAPKAFGCDGHMSYPYLFEEAGELYCVPEQLETRAITLFRYDRAADRWCRFATALTGTPAADPALFRFGGKYWIAYTDTGIDAYNNLCLVWADALAGPWHRHDRHPVKVDVRSSRSAGTPFVERGALYRPAQDCSRTYGGAVALNRVLVCTPHAYEEEVAAVLRPDPSGPARHGLHTLSRWGERTLIDGKQYAFSPSVLGRKVMKTLSRRLAALKRPRRGGSPAPAGLGMEAAGEGPAPNGFSERTAFSERTGP